MPAVEAGQERGVSLLAPLTLLGDYDVEIAPSCLRAYRWLGLATTTCAPPLPEDGDPLDEVYVHDAAIAVLAQGRDAVHDAAD